MFMALHLLYRLNFWEDIYEMPIAQTSFFSADPEPGNYALIAEPTTKQVMVKEFTIK
jgi:hypothetical protein